jgi:3-carboxy-cis,cis-muconate cycloisomerase
VSGDRFADVVYALSATLAAMAKIAGDFAFLMSTDVGELREPYMQGRGSSSTMPQKRNPVICEAVIEGGALRSAPAGEPARGHDAGSGAWNWFSYLERDSLAEAVRLTASGMRPSALNLG